MLLISEIDSIITLISILAIFVILISLILRKLNQTYIIGYILVGIILGQNGFGIIEDAESIHLFGELGVILLLFFIGMEINLVDFLKQWKVALLGTLAQVIISVSLVFCIGYFFNWNFARSMIIGFVIALSSSAVVIKLLQDKNLIDTTNGKNVLSILLTQDVIFVPMLLIISQLGGKTQTALENFMMVVGAIIIISLLLFIYIKKTISFPLAKRIVRDHELQVFLAIFLCFAGALFTSIFGLSAALGAFVGGMIINSAKETHWIHDTLQSFRVLFVSFFFISVGLQMDIQFIYSNLWIILLSIAAVYLTNQFINSLILRAFSCTWKEALLGGALLSQIGELSFLLSSMALSLHIINDFGYKFTISLISLTLIISPFWISCIERLVGSKKTT
ncbi:cation:proton antiporter [Aquimarina addita]|uniref:Cation:proton antiporter n=1 Tax=Aquimarina addita TaxID=870485 RepID=A0ABP6UWA2_9FLAO